MRNRFLATFLLCVATALSPVGVVQADDDHDDAPKCSDCGVVTAVQVVEKSGGSGLGAAAGAIAGGLLGNKTTDGNTVATVAGVAGGALSGHLAEQALRKGKEWNVMVKMSNGETRTVTMTADPKVQAGTQVRVSEGSVVAYKAKSSDDSDHEEEKEKHDD
jgi:outer membrane lipoprotein SlyB